MPAPQPSRLSGVTARRLLAALVASLIMLADTLLRPAVDPAVLYVLPLALAAHDASPRTMLALTGLAALLTLLGFGLAHGAASDAIAWLDLALALAVLFVAAGLLLNRRRWCRARLAAEAARARAAWRYRSVFGQSRFPIMELDFSAAIQVLKRLKAEGVLDLEDFAARNPGFLDRIRRLVRFVDMNEVMFEHYGLKRGVDPDPEVLADIETGDAQLLRVLQAIHEGKEQYDGSGYTLRRNGQRVSILLGVSISYDGEHAGSAVATLVDISEREQAHEALAAAQAELARASRVAAVGAVSASIAHELNQPIGAMVLNGQNGLRYLRRSPPDTAHALAAVERLAGQAARAADIVRATGEISRKQRLRLEPVDLRALVKDGLSLAAREIESAGVALSARLATAPAPLRGDPIVLQQALHNLVVNAVYAMAELPRDGRRLIVDLHVGSGQAVVGVTDSGPGVADDQLARIFEPFFTTKDGGMGVGLAISRTAIEAHGGSLTVRNLEHGGACFEMALPLEQAARSARLNA